jgi:hypothetical protein
MAQEQKNILPPNIPIPKTLLLFMEGFTAQSEHESKLIFEQALKSISCNDKLTKLNLQGGYNLFLKISPQDAFERVWCAQFIVGHLLGMHSLALASPRDKRIALKLLKAADDAMERLDKKQKGVANAC